MWGFTTIMYQNVLKGWRTDDRPVSQAIYPSFIQLTCGGNIVKGVHEKKPISLTPWLALKTFWATDCETVKKQQMKEEWEQNGERSTCVFFWKDSFISSFIFKHGRRVRRATKQSRKVPKCPITSKDSSTYQTVAAYKDVWTRNFQKNSPTRWCSVSCCSGRDLTWKPSGQLKQPKAIVGIVEGKKCRVSWFRHCGAAFVLHDRKPPGGQLETAQIYSPWLLKQNPEFSLAVFVAWSARSSMLRWVLMNCEWEAMMTSKQTNSVPKGEIAR